MINLSQKNPIDSVQTPHECHFRPNLRVNNSSQPIPPEPTNQPTSTSPHPHNPVHQTHHHTHTFPPGANDPTNPRTATRKKKKKAIPTSSSYNPTAPANPNPQRFCRGSDPRGARPRNTGTVPSASTPRPLASERHVPPRRRKPVRGPRPDLRVPPRRTVGRGGSDAGVGGPDAVEATAGWAAWKSVREMVFADG